ncbi:uncharacterized protein N7511_003951 [Penicillium nucicola]|uniref:uncharacterized protein n=1 Tax=Penicillium nucicola TaxID=1850975 RepID=UPI002545060A|nr:uncharacterized protein N7511_003951 [Penicillium nucicola]KAJ5766335.1 hypothetical protein N7511_003951 [Penicillium nucicola]
MSASDHSNYAFLLSNDEVPFIQYDGSSDAAESGGLSGQVLSPNDASSPYARPVNRAPFVRPAASPPALPANRAPFVRPDTSTTAQSVNCAPFVHPAASIPAQPVNLAPFVHSASGIEVTDENAAEVIAGLNLNAPAILPQQTTQADHLPYFVWTKIPKVRKLTKDRGQEPWTTDVTNVLFKLKILDVIDNTLPHPDESHHHYKDWIKWSRLVKKWTYRVIGPEIMPHFENFAEDLQFADETVALAVALSVKPTPIDRSQDDRMTKEVYSLWDMKRHDYTDVSDYIENWNAQVQHCRRIGLGIPNYVAAKILLRELDDDFPLLTTCINTQIREQDAHAHKMTHGQLCDIVEAFRAAALSRERGSGRSV